MIKPKMNRTALIVPLLVATGLACNLPFSPTAVPSKTGETDPSVGDSPDERPTGDGDLNQDPSAIQFTCEQPQMDALALGALWISDKSPTLKSLAFLELPFPYDGGNENFGGSDFQFRQVSQRRGSGGRINSFFDHLQPLYPAPFGREPKEPPVGENILIFDGILSDSDWYSGHPGYDYSTFIFRDRSTPVFAAADGVVQFVGEAYGGALTVRIDHTVEGVGEFRTIYMHLYPDRHFEAMRAGVGRSVVAGTRIGTMGNTGNSTGPHLHFEVRFDANDDGKFTLNEVIDPYGFVPSKAYPSDPWGLRFSAISESQAPENESSVSPYLWIHPLTASAIVPDGGGGKMELEIGLGDNGKSATLCAQEGSLPPGGSVFWGLSPSPPPTDSLAGTGDGFVITGIDEEGRPVPAFDPPFEVIIPIDIDFLDYVDLSTLRVYWLDPEQGLWFPQPTEFNAAGDLARVLIDRPGRFAVLGDPTRDQAPPDIEFQVSGPMSEGVFYNRVEIAITSEDLSGVALVQYSVDSFQSFPGWLRYSEPFLLERNGIPEGLPEGEEPGEVSGGLRGHFVVRVSAVDNEGNRIDPPIVYRILIDPAENPEPTVTALVDLDCRLGPGSTKIVVGSLLKGQTAELDGRNADSTWWRVQRAGRSDSCWVSGIYVVTSGDPNTLSIIAPPSTAPPEETGPIVLSPPAAPTGLASSHASCPGLLTLTWTDNANNEDGYRVSRNGNEIASIPANLATYIDNDTVNNYGTYEVEAFNGAGTAAATLAVPSCLG